MAKMNGTASDELILEMVEIASLRPHPRNYKAHPDDQLEHIMQSIRENEVYRNVVIARDGTILAGHGVVKAAQKLGRTRIAVRRLDLDPNEPRAIKVMTSDNEVAHLGDVDDRALSELLKEIKDFDVAGLLGTGYDEMMLANLVMVTRPASEIADFDAAAEWVGLPEYEDGEQSKFKLIITFREADDRELFANTFKLQIDKKQERVWTTRWPFTEREDLASLRFEG